ncbi:TetR family transcriptional regulator [Streptomyces longwoodensis]|uniref:TetR family transcriptional regulator n=1 Tax=Streptomyces longwoodensis TaxID=68231 RepID=A0A101R2Y7_9ACTN|nr:TetR family transcriptional regulator [Streptomyces longwoodensis]KUN40714.1 TetR family transcriptional regulator [Streptomyces longwoodensis]
MGAGTLYRDFPTRESLVLAVYQDEVDRILGTLPGLQADHPPLEAPRRWTTDLVEAMRQKHGLGNALSPGAHRSIAEQTCGPVVAAITRILDAGNEDGSILQLTGCCGVRRGASGPDDRSPRVPALILDGLRAQGRP